MTALLGQPIQGSPYLQQALQAMGQQAPSGGNPAGSAMANAIMQQAQGRRQNMQANQPAMNGVNANLAAAGLSPVQPQSQNFGQRLMGGLHMFGGG